MPSAVQEVLDILDLEPLEVNLFRGRSPQSRWQRVFGGQVIGQALVAACRTVADVTARPPHSLHAYFLLGGDPKVPIIYEVDRIRDGKSFTTRNVKAIQHGHAIFSMSVSFHLAEPGLNHQVKMPECRSRTNCRATRNSRTASIRCCPNRRGATTSASGRSNSAPWSSAAISAKNPRTAASISGSAPPAGCPTSRRSINACWPTPPT